MRVLAKWFSTANFSKRLRNKTKNESIPHIIEQRRKKSLSQSMASWKNSMLMNFARKLRDAGEIKRSIRVRIGG